MAASGFVKELVDEYEDSELQPDEELESNSLEESEQKNSQEIVPEVSPETKEALKESTESSPVEPLRPVTETLPAEDNVHLVESLVESVSVLDPEDGEDVAELTDMLTDWTGIKSKNRGAGSTASLSTIHPDVVKERVKKTITKRQNFQAVQRIRAKGEASAATRKKRENKDLIRSDGVWGWDN